MKIFLSWSGDSSYKVAQSLRNWLPTILQATRPWLSDQDMEKGAQWSIDIGKQLEDSDVCIVCLTPEALESKWIHFEAGAASKFADDSLICPYLVGLKKSDLTGPLTQFQAAYSDKLDTLKLIKAINNRLNEKSVNDETLTKTFYKFWPDLDQDIKKINLSSETPPLRSEADILQEILERVRRIENKERTHYYQLINNPKELTHQEREIGSMVASGLDNEQIASILNTSVSSVAFQIRDLYKKTGAANRANFVALLLTPDRREL